MVALRVNSTPVGVLNLLRGLSSVDSVGRILLGLDRQIQATGGDLAIPSEQSWIHLDQQPGGDTPNKTSASPSTLLRTGSVEPFGAPALPWVNAYAHKGLCGRQRRPHSVGYRLPTG